MNATQEAHAPKRQTQPRAAGLLPGSHSGVRCRAPWPPSPRDPSSMLSSDVHGHGSRIVRDRWQYLKAYPVLPFG
jgi:hypothetical protein